MTPEQAADLLERLKQATAINDQVYAETYNAIIPMLETIAGLEWEYSSQRLDISGGWVQFTQWHKNLAVVEHAANLKAQNTTKGKTRIVRRLVSKPQPIGDNQ
ncbi:hypothetical protein HW450_06585 [Corynebacterium hindlerae]|uniref:Uncharacterized protein n=1 Tax=Corynebacterium hindlerae TaxID=699041 RepID=A0A7G5FIB6_9CORY|nr:hypothetical protein [Corynebacterium hindlerae]QMV86357.1 hypothetical protein HW450_06585 [Corynebacterium hindlerae]